MSLILWHAGLDVKLPEIDVQHRHLIEIVNELYDAAVSRKSREILAGILDRLICETVDHFATEEEIMQEAVYPEFHLHQVEHNILKTKVLGFQRDFLADRVVLTPDVLQFVQNWLDDHITGADRRLAEFLRTSGVRT